MTEFLKFFDEKVKTYPMHMEICYSKVMDWTIYVYRLGCGENGEILVLVDVQDCDMELAFAKAQVQLKNWFLENEGGY